MSVAYEAVVQSAFSLPECLIHVFIGGSQLHGAKVASTDDLDVYGVFIEPPVVALGLSPIEHFVWSSAPDDRRNTSSDVDVTLYSLRKMVRMCAKGNPTALHFLYAKNELQNEIWAEIVHERELFLSKGAGEHFLGFALDQFKRVTGEKGGGKKGIRHEYVGEFGYDTKAAMHGCRLLFECIELMRDARLTFPCSEVEFLRSVRRGEWALDALRPKFNELFEEAESAIATTALPVDVDRTALSELITTAHLKHWKLRAV